MKKNKRERESERTPDHSDMIDSQVLWMLLYHSRRVHRRQVGFITHHLLRSGRSHHSLLMER